MMAKDKETIRPEDLEWVPASREADETAVDAEKEQGAAGADQLPPIVEQKIKEAAEAQEKYLRTYADFENYRKRMQRDVAEFRKYANEQLAAELLTVVDHLGLALKHAAEAGETGQGLREGVELVYKQIRDVLEKYGIKPFASEGEKFDPAKHDAVMQETTDRASENTVAQVFQEGYVYHDKVLRHAKVSVAKKPAAAPEQQNKTE